jgi:hypothetical protein
MMIQAPWFDKVKQAHAAGPKNLYMLGIKWLHIRYNDYHQAGYQNLPKYHKDYVVNPFVFQYDLLLFVWINYYKILSQEIKLLKASKYEEDQFMAQTLKLTNKLYGIDRSDVLFAAAELRWPTTLTSEGSYQGLFVRDPWSVRRVEAASDEFIKTIITFGGGGQGKTHISIGVALMLFDYYMFTLMGARCMISTVNIDKLNSVGWSRLCTLNSTTSQDISITAGRGKVSGDHVLARPGNKDRGGVFKGILIGNQMNQQNIIDKLTGSHGHPFVVYIMDEMQSTPDPPILAAPNYTMHATDFRILCSGNWGENDDTLAKNIRPDIGWENVNDETGSWISTTQNHSKALVVHFNNQMSPGMTPEGHNRYRYLPSQKILDDKYPDKLKRTLKDPGYRRFWVGFRMESGGENTVIYDALVKENLADLPLDLKKVVHSFFGFDSAPAELDRNINTIFREGICNHTGHRVFGISHIHLLAKATESTKYYHESSKELYDLAKKNQIMSGGGIVDWTGRPAHAEELQKMGFKVHRLIYNKGVPDGIRRDKHTKRIERAIHLNIDLDFKQDLPKEKVCAHHVAENQISLGAWALREYIKAGRVRGINSNLMKMLNNERSLEDELYNRKYVMKNSVQYGSRFHLETKDKFKETFGFSPDILDTLFQGAFYMLVVRNFPLTPVGIGDTVDPTVKKREEQEDHLSLWEHDLAGLES